MSEVKMIVHNIKGIVNGVIDVPIENGIFCFVGNNGVGKSTIMSCLAQLISRHNLGLLKEEDYFEDSFVEFYADGIVDHWYCKDDFWITDNFPKTIRFNGTSEGSLFYGMRFKDSREVDNLMHDGKIAPHDLADADDYVQQQLGQILHNDDTYYTGLKRIRNKNIAERLSLSNTPYFKSVNGKLISQYRMSSGECLLISLLHFIYNSLIRRSLPTNKPILMLIDEIELALHPVAVTNLLTLLEDLTNSYNNLTVVLTSHSPEVIRKIKPSNLYKIERTNDDMNVFNIVNPCYPSYAIRDVYTHDGFDYLLLVEDELARMVVKSAIEELHLENSRLINVLPVGGWTNVLKLQYELINNNVLGVGKTVFSILDGDVAGKIPKEYRCLKSFFLPVQSVEKFLLEHLILKPDYTIKKQLNDRFFNIESLDTLIREYKQHEKLLSVQQEGAFKSDTDGKRLYETLKKHLLSKRISVDSFLDGIFIIIKANIDLTNFNQNLQKALTF